MECNFKILSFFSFFAVIFSIFYLYSKFRYRYFKTRKIPHIKPKFFFGSADQICLGRKSMLEFQKDVYEKSKSTKLLGLYMFFKPTVYIADMHWIKDILVKDYHYFRDRGLEFDTTSEPLTGHLFHLQGQRWKYMRNKVKPIFASDGIQILFPLLAKSADKLKNYVGQISDEVLDLDLKDILGRYAADVVGNCAFGAESGALDRGKTKFLLMSRKIFSPRVKTIIKLILPKLPKFFSEFFDINMIEKEVSEYFTKVMRDEIESRRGNRTYRNDFLDFMMDVQKRQVHDGGNIIIYKIFCLRGYSLEHRAHAQQEALRAAAPRQKKFQFPKHIK